ncbi:MAG: OsmC family protein [Flavobacteriales bacterium]|nr:OsmC family protein [Flavobacteriales bacterium]
MSKKHVVATIGVGHYETQMRTRDHELISDEPIDAGGGDLGPSPSEYLCMALGACKTITMRMYADRKGWPLESAEVHVDHERINADSIEEEGYQGLVSVFTVSYELKGALDDTQQKRLMAIADRCPVHRTLSNGSLIRHSA